MFIKQVSPSPRSHRHWHNIQQPMHRLKVKKGLDIYLCFFIIILFTSLNKQASIQQIDNKIHRSSIISNNRFYDKKSKIQMFIYIYIQYVCIFIYRFRALLFLKCLKYLNSFFNYFTTQQNMEGL